MRSRCPSTTPVGHVNGTPQGCTACETAPQPPNPLSAPPQSIQFLSAARRHRQRRTGREELARWPVLVGVESRTRAAWRPR